MQRLGSTLLALLLCCCLSGSQGNRVYVHPFYLFAAENVSCETLNTPIAKPLETRPVAALDIEILTADSRDPTALDVQNSMGGMAVLAKPLNSVVLRMYLATSTKQPGSNILFSPINIGGSLVTLYLGVSKKTAKNYQNLFGLARGTDREDCVSLVNGHAVLQTLQSINSLVDDGAKDGITTTVWAFTAQDSHLSEYFVEGMKVFSDTSYTRGVNFSKPEEAEQLVNSFVAKTSGEKVKNIFKDVNSSSNLLFLTSFQFQDKWKKGFKAEKTSLEEFHVNETTTVMVPLMTYTGQYFHLNDETLRCTVVKLPMSKQTYMLLVLPHEDGTMQDFESQLERDIMSSWNQNLQEGLLKLSLPKFSMSSVVDLREILVNTDPELEATLLGSKAEFTRFSNTEPFTVDKVFNQVTFEVSEDEAEQEVKAEAGVPLTLSFNKPFFFAVIEGNSDSILMLGKVNNPTL